MMKVKVVTLPLFFIFLSLFLSDFFAARSAAAPLSPLPTSTEVNPSVMFVENVGQFNDAARFQVRGEQGTMWLTEDAFWFTLLSPTDNAPTTQFTNRAEREQRPERGVNIKLSFVGANTTPMLEPFSRRETAVNYFRGNQTEQWYSDVPVWGGVRYAALYPGLDLELAGELGQLRPRFVCYDNCSSALQRIHLQVEGAESLRLVGDQIILTTSIGDFVMPSFTLVMNDRSTATLTALIPRPNGNRLTFSPATLNLNTVHPAYPPGMAYSTFLGGNSYDGVQDIAIDETGNAYLTGSTFSTNFPTTPGTFDPTHNGGFTDAVVVKLNAAGSDLVYTTFIGGNDDDYGNAIAIDGIGNATIAGTTDSVNFPVTSGVFDPTHNGGSDIFVARLNSAGNALSYATFLGGTDDDRGNDLVMDEIGNMYIVGETTSTDFPTTAGAYDTSFNGEVDVFAFKLDATGTSLIYATYLGSEESEKGLALKRDGTNSVYITGFTGSVNFPVTPGAFDPTYNGPYDDAFVVKLNSTGSDLIYATYLGGADYDQGSDIAVDDTGHAYVVGFTFSADFPTTPGTFDPTFNGGNNDIFVVKLNPTGNNLSYSTFIGNEGTDWGWGITLDDAHNAYVVGYSSSINFPTTSDAFDTTYNGGEDAILTILDAAAQNVIYSTFLGGGANDGGGRVVQDGINHVYYLGNTQAFDFPTTPGAFDTSYNGGTWDSFVLKLAWRYAPVQAGFSGSPTSGVAPLNISFTNLSTGDYDTCAWDFGDGTSSSTCGTQDHPYGTAGSYTVTLSVSGLGGSDTITQPAYITVYEPVQADFAAAPTTGHAPLPVLFTNLASGDFTACLWEWGDGATSTECNNPIHTYDGIGSYTVALTISGAGGTAIEIKTDYVVVTPQLFFLPVMMRPQ